MTTTTNLPPAPAWLREFCSKDDTIRAVLCDPFPIEYEGAPALVATNGHVLALVTGAFDVPTPDRPTPGKVPAILRDALSRPTRRVRLAALRAFCDVKPLGAPCPVCDATGTVECPMCDGRGETEHECSCGHVHEAPCEDCDDDGRVRCTECRGDAGGATVPVDLGGVHFNRRLLGDVVRALPGDGVVTWHDGGYGSAGGSSVSEGGKPAALVGDGWVAAIMPITHRTEPPPAFAGWED